jgi:hypothetical protein
LCFLIYLFKPGGDLIFAKMLPVPDTDTAKKMEVMNGVSVTQVILLTDLTVFWAVMVRHAADTAPVRLPEEWKFAHVNRDFILSVSNAFLMKPPRLTLLQ